jgi:hypothetical protein
MEDRLQAEVVADLTSRGARLHMSEYEVVPGHAQYGRGDLWFTKDGINLAVEVKANKGTKVDEQARVYGAWVFALTQGEPTLYASYVGNRPGSCLDQVRATVKRMKRHEALTTIQNSLRRVDSGMIPKSTAVALGKSLSYFR